MPLAPFKSTPIEVVVSDRIINDTVIKQKAVFESLTHRQMNGQSNAIIVLNVTMYASKDGEFGEQLTGDGFLVRRKELTAANDTLVDANTGEVLAVNDTYMPTDEWVKTAEGFKQVVMFQGDFFEFLRDNVAIEIGAVIRQHIANADKLGRFV